MFQTAKQKPADDFRFQRTKKKTKARPDESVRGKQKRLTDAMRMRSGASASRPPRMNERDETKKKTDHRNRNGIGAAKFVRQMAVRAPPP